MLLPLRLENLRFCLISWLFRMVAVPAMHSQAPTAAKQRRTPPCAAVRAAAAAAERGAGIVAVWQRQRTPHSAS